MQCACIEGLHPVIVDHEQIAPPVSGTIAENIVCFEREEWTRGDEWPEQLDGHHASDEWCEGEESLRDGGWDRKSRTANDWVESESENAPPAMQFENDVVDFTM